ncbi:MAG: hypothetical protein ACFFBD_02910 [Candidatus Hodarchaeota archaeon]
MSPSPETIQEKINTLTLEKVQLMQENVDDLSKVQAKIDAIENQIAKLLRELKEIKG